MCRRCVNKFFAQTKPIELRHDKADEICWISELPAECITWSAWKLAWEVRFERGWAPAVIATKSKSCDPRTYESRVVSAGSTKAWYWPRGSQGQKEASGIYITIHSPSLAQLLYNALQAPEACFGDESRKDCHTCWKNVTAKQWHSNGAMSSAKHASLFIYTMFVNGWRIAMHSLGMPSPSYDRIRLGKGQALFATTSEPASRRRAFNQAAVFERGRAKPASETGKVTAQTLIEHWLHTLIQWFNDWH